MKNKSNLFVNITNKLKPIDKMTVTFIGIIICSLIGFIFARFGIHNYEQKQVSYNENSNIEYKVYLKDNNFFEEEYLEENRTYITSLIDYLNITFNYDVDFSEKMSGSYSYYIKGIISADKVGDSSDSYWTKEYKLSDTITKEYTDSDKLEISKKIKIKYQDYNDLLASFKAEYGLSMEGHLKIVLVVLNNIKSDFLDRDIMKETNSELDIPLTSLTIEVPIKAEGVSSEGLLIDETVYDDSLVFLVTKIIGYVFFAFAGVLIIFLFFMLFKEIKNESIYYKKLKKILKVYDGIIVSIKEIPKLDNFNVVNVDSFEELIDAHSEVRRPINYIQKNNGSTFLLITEGIVYKYFLARELFNNTNNKEKNEVSYEK